MKQLVLFFFLLLCFSACKTGSPFSSRKNPHEAYGDQLRSAGLENSVLAKTWFRQAQLALSEPRKINLPYREQGYFAAEEPRAVGLLFTAKRGQKLNFDLRLKNAVPAAFYAEIWRSDAGKNEIIHPFDTSERAYEYEVREEGTYLLRLQPELLSAVSYEVSISIAPSLAFPVSGTNRKIGSFWGDNRDAGARSHEGIDIFAPKRTPAVAAADGRITSVTENRLGGKVVFLRPSGADYTLYYAHLDSQLVSQGQAVRVGDVVGWVGNTGNARTTPSHLHFGIYTNRGAIDPFPFVQPEIQEPAPLPVTSLRAGDVARLISARRVEFDGTSQESLPNHTWLKVDALTTKGVVVRLPDERSLFLPSTGLERAVEGFRTVSLADSSALLDRPEVSGLTKSILPKGSRLEVRAVSGDYWWVVHGNQIGWLRRFP